MVCGRHGSLLRLACAATAGVAAASEATTQELYFDGQYVDHYAATGAGQWGQRYFRSSQYFKGPGHPILLVIGGEGSMGDQPQIFYPWVQVDLAKRFGALVVQPEHRFYGPSQPVAKDAAGQWARLLTPSQALEDLVRFTGFIKSAENCTDLRFTQAYCPVIAIGGSYPGFLSMAARLRFPAIFDGAYSASAPVRLYAQEVDQAAYYAVITRTAEEAVPGCTAGVRSAFAALYTRAGIASATVHDVARLLGVCDGGGAFRRAAGEPQLPEYMRHELKIFLEEISMVIMFTFATLNMGYYPPSAGNPLVQVCGSFADAGGDEVKLLAALQNMLRSAVGSAAGKRKKPGTRRLELALAAAGLPASSCSDLSVLLTGGENPTITCGDWSGCGQGTDGDSWDLQTSTLLVERIGATNITDMFPPRNFTMEWLEAHATRRFGAGARPRPVELEEAWGFASEMLRGTGASKILFTNGLRDGWSSAGILVDLAPERDLLTINMPTGAHHSDLSHQAPSEMDTPDVMAARARGADILERWIRDGTATSLQETPRLEPEDFLLYS